MIVYSTDAERLDHQMKLLAVRQKGGGTMKVDFKSVLVFSKKLAAGLLILVEALEKLGKL